MKITVLCLAIAALFVGTQLEARSHFSFNVGLGPFFAPQAYVVQPAPVVPAYTYVDPMGYPYGRPAVVMQPAPVYYPVAPAAPVSFGFGWKIR